MALLHRLRPSGKLSLIFGLIISVSIGFLGSATVATTTTLTADPNPSVYGQTVRFTATVTVQGGGDQIPSGTVDFFDNGVLLGTAPLSTSAPFQAHLDVSTLSVGEHSITAKYGGDPDTHPSTSDPLIQTVNKRATTTTVMGSETPLIVNNTAIFTVTVSEPVTGAIPTGTISFFLLDGTGTFDPASGPIALDAVGQATFTYTPTSGDITSHRIRVVFHPSGGTFLASEGFFDQEVIKRAADMGLTLNPTTAYIFQEVTVTIHVEDDTTAGIPVIPQGTVTFDDGGKAGVFSVGDVPGTTWYLDGSGNLTVTYTPGPWDAGVTTITATYSGSSVHTPKSTIQLLTVELRPTETTVDCVDSDGDHDAMLVNETGRCTVIVRDVAGVGTATAPLGTLEITNSLSPGDVSMHMVRPFLPDTPDSSKAEYTYTRIALDLDADFDTIGAIFDPNGGIHAASAGGYAQAIYRRPTETSLSLTATAAGYDATVTVREAPALPGIPSVPTGDILDMEGNFLCSLVGGSCTFSGDTDALMANVTVQYDPDNRVHLKSSASENVLREDHTPTTPSGAIDVVAITHGLNAGCLAAGVAALALDIAELIIDTKPDPVVGVAVGWGVAVVIGKTIPTSDILASVIGFARVALEGYKLVACTDLDGDGIPGIVEAMIGTSDSDHDSDDDGMDDIAEIYNANGLFGGDPRASPDPTDPDSDDDGLKDGLEWTEYQTNFSDWDSDDDGLGDGQEVGTWGLLDIRDHADPLMHDTDGDGLSDLIEFDLAGSPAHRPFINDDDSDDDGLQDGHEDRNRDGAIENIIGNSTTQGSGETHFRNPDTDGDGLSDGVEEGLIGRSATPHGVSMFFSVDGPPLVITIPALDDDSDNDGLSDYEEVNITGTDPLDADSDNDTISDANELIATGGTWPNRTFIQESDPLDPDTDDDGLTDNIEFGTGGTGLGISRTTGGTPDNLCPYVNDDDSDDDGLQDGHEDANQDGTITKTLGNSITQGIGETDFCDPDTDGDGLLDGVEEGLIGRSATPHGVSMIFGAAGSPLAITIPALDDDSDNDGLSDFEEINITGTDPLDADSDNDTISDTNELIATGGTWPHRTFIQESDPLDPDTDDDGLTDNIEFGTGGTGLGISRTTGGTPDNLCPYVNDADSDDDGLQDGHEDTNQDGTITKTLGNSIAQGSGETDFCNSDTDGDGLSDGEEEGLIGRSATPHGVSMIFGAAGPPLAITIPALDDDSDNDGLSDFEEVNITGTDPLDADSDNDTISDANELIATGGIWPHRTFIQESDPLDPDTDDDGLTDNIEFGTGGTGLGISRTTGGTPDNLCPYVNDDDSDDDGLQDGHEDRNRDGVIENIIGNSTIQGSGETDFCNPDTDGDGLSDGEEEGLIGRSATPHGVSMIFGVDGPPLAITIPALDDDSDNDGLSDYEEVNITGTDPLDADSDNDTISDANELIATGGTWPNRTFIQESDPLDPNTDDDGLTDNIEFGIGGTGLGISRTTGGTPDNLCPYVNDDDSDDDGIQDGAVITIRPAGVITSYGGQFTYTHHEGFVDIVAADVAHPGVVRTIATPGFGEQQDDALCNVCDPDSDGDGLNDGEEIAIGTDPSDWDTDDDGRNDWHEVTGGGSIPTNPFDPDTDNDGLLDSAEVFGTNRTNPVNADTDGDGLCDGGAKTPWMTSGDARVIVNPICKACVDGHPNPHGYGEDKDGDGTWGGAIGQLWQSGLPGSPETDPNQYDTDGDAIGDGIEILGFSTCRQARIPTTDLLGRTINVTYPKRGCLEPLIADTDGDGLADGCEDTDHDGTFDFFPSDFDFAHKPLPGPPHPNPAETNPCDPDTDDDGLTDREERHIRPLNPTNPLDHDTDNDWLLDGEEVRWVCFTITHSNLDNDSDGLTDEDPVDGLDNDGDGLIDEDPVDFFVRFVPMLDPTNRDSDFDGFIDGLDDDPCNSELIPLLRPVELGPIDSDGDGFADDDEAIAGTHPNDPEDYPAAYSAIDLDFDQLSDDRMWLERSLWDGSAHSVAIDIDSNMLVDVRVMIVAPRDVQRGDFDGDGFEDDYRYTVFYAFSGHHRLQPRVVLTIYDYNGDLVIDRAEAARRL